MSNKTMENRTTEVGGQVVKMHQSTLKQLISAETMEGHKAKVVEIQGLLANPFVNVDFAATAAGAWHEVEKQITLVIQALTPAMKTFQQMSDLFGEWPSITKSISVACRHAQRKERYGRRRDRMTARGNQARLHNGRLGKRR